MADQASIKLSESDIIIGRKFNNSKLILAFHGIFQFLKLKGQFSALYFP
jgi:hypothetical protein